MRTKLPDLSAQDNRTCERVPKASAAVKPAPGTYDVKPIVAYVDRLQNAYRRCAALQRRNITVLRGERRRAN